MIFNTFDPTDIVAGRIQPVSTGMWAGGAPQQTAFFTASLQTLITGSSKFEPLNGMYYTNVYDQDPSASATVATAEIYFSLTYGHAYGSGSSGTDLDTSTGSLIAPTKAIYGQYRNLLLTPGDDLFTFFTGSNLTPVNSVHIYVMNFKGDKAKDRLDPAQFELTLSGTSGSFTFITDARYQTDSLATSGGKRFNIVSGSLSGSYTAGASAPVVYQGVGSMYPDLGIVILNPDALHAIVGLIQTSAGPTVLKSLNDFSSATTAGNQTIYPGTSTTALAYSDYALMQNRLFRSITGGSSIKARVTEYVPSRHYFVRVKNQEFNYSNNPTFVISSTEDPTNAGNLRFASFSSDPKVYVTAVGLYNDNNDLVAVAKMSQPILKDFSSEALIKIRLDF